jgi:hypothetical protein
MRAALLLAPALLLSTVADASAQVIWRGRSGGFDITWSADDISARRVSDGTLVLSLKRDVDAEWGDLAAAEPDEPVIREVEATYRLLSVVGPIVSVEEYWYCDCGGAHPISSRRFIAYDLRRSTPTEPRAAPITGLLSEADVLRALLADRVVRGTMDSVGVRTARSLAALVDTISHVPVEANECFFAVDESFPSAFALHHVDAGRVAVRFGLSHHYEICRGLMTQVGVLVPVPPALRAGLAAAESRRAGFLMKDAVRISRGGMTRFTYRPRRR